MENLTLNAPGRATLALHADDPINNVTDVSPPLHVSTNYRYSDNPEELSAWADVDKDVHLNSSAHHYSRHSAPNSTRFETILTSLLGAPALAYSSGLSALHAALVLLNPRHISVGNGYHGSHDVINLISRLSGLQKLPLDCPAESLEKGDVILLETPVNPLGTSFNIEEFAKKAHGRGAILMVDSTFGPPGLQDPFKWGADIVMHSGTKYLGGHSDMLCGVLATRNKEWRNQLLEERLYLGSVMGNLESWLGVRSLRTLEIRVQRLSYNGTKIVGWLDDALRAKNPAPGSAEAIVQRAVESVAHSSLQKEEMGWLSKQMPNGYGPVFAMVLKEEKFSRAFPSKLKLFHHATSLGGVESLIEWRAMTDDTVDRRLLRVSIGLENWEDLRDDLLAGFKALLA